MTKEINDLKRAEIKGLIFSVYRRYGIQEPELTEELGYAVDDIVEKLSTKTPRRVLLDGKSVEIVDALFAVAKIGDQKRATVDGKDGFKHVAEYINVALVKEEVKFVKETVTYFQPKNATTAKHGLHVNEYSLIEANDIKKVSSYIYF